MSRGSDKNNNCVTCKQIILISFVIILILYIKIHSYVFLAEDNNIQVIDYIAYVLANEYIHMHGNLLNSNWIVILYENTYAVHTKIPLTHTDAQFLDSYMNLMSKTSDPIEARVIIKDAYTAYCESHNIRPYGRIYESTNISKSMLYRFWYKQADFTICSIDTLVYTQEQREMYWVSQLLVEDKNAKSVLPIEA